MAVDPNAGVSTTKLVRPDPQLLDAGLVLGPDPGGCERVLRCDAESELPAPWSLPLYDVAIRISS